MKTLRNLIERINRAWLRYQVRRLQARESRAFYRQHGRVVKVERRAK